MKFLVTNSLVHKKTFSKLPFELKKISIGNFNIIIEKGFEFSWPE
jgi:hypothetical protein